MCARVENDQRGETGTEGNKPDGGKNGLDAVVSGGMEKKAAEAVSEPDRMLLAAILCTGM